MRKQARVNKHMLIKCMAFSAALCMIIVNIHISALAKENELATLENEDTLSETLESGQNELNDDSQENGKTEENIQEEQRPAPSEGTEGEKPIPSEGTEEENPVSGEGTEGEEPVSSEGTEEENPVSGEGTEGENPVSSEGTEEEKLVPSEETEGEKPASDESTEEKKPEIEEENGVSEMLSDNSAETEEETISGNSIETEEETISGNSIGTENGAGEAKLLEIIDVVVPTTYTLALNPYSLPISTGEDEITTEQVISGKYGIVNKSSTDQVVKVSLMVEDMNEGVLVFTDSAEEARSAGENVYAVYLSAVPADEGEILVEGLPADINTKGDSLQNVSMNGAQEQAVTLNSGVNQIGFRLSAAVYSSGNDEEYTLDDLEDNLEDDAVDETPEMVLEGLAPDGTGVTAYTFYGAMNPNAAWEELSGGIKISVVYTYQTADGSEEIIEGTGAMVNID